MCQSASWVPYVDQELDIRTFFVTQDREKSTDSVQGTAVQESIDSVEGEESTVQSNNQQPTHPVPLSSGRSDFTLSGTFSNNLRPPNWPSTAVHAYAQDCMKAINNWTFGRPGKLRNMRLVHT